MSRGDGSGPMPVSAGEGVAAFGPLDLVTVRVEEENAAGGGTETGLTFLTEPVTGGALLAWYVGM